MIDAAGTGFDVVVLAGGDGRRLGGVDKAALEIGDRTLLDQVLASCGAARRVVVVGPQRPTSVVVTWTRESPPSSGPVAGLAAGVTALPEPGAPTVVVLAADLPFLTTAAVDRLISERGDGDAVLYTDTAGRRQPLCAAYSRDALTAALHDLGPPAGASMRALLERLTVRTIPDTSGVSRDIDTPDDLARARTESR